MSSKKHFWCFLGLFIGSINLYAQFCEPDIQGNNSIHLDAIRLDGLEYEMDFSLSYENKTNQSFALEAGKSYPLSLKGHSLGNASNSQTVWIDWNNNQTFEESEKISHPDNPNSTLLGYVNLTIVVPKNQSCENRRMRIMLSAEDKKQSIIPSPCISSNPETGLSVEVRDLSIYIKGDCKNALEKFEVNDKQGNVYLNWRTNKIESENSKFIIEYSEDAVNFTSLETIEGNNSRLFEYIDKTRDFSNLCFYRLKYISANGLIQYSQVKGLMVMDRNPSLVLYPNPLPQGSELKIKTNTAEKINWIRAFDISGRLIIDEAREEETQINLNTKKLEPGIYFIEINRENFYKIEVIYYKEKLNQ